MAGCFGFACGCVIVSGMKSINFKDRVALREVKTHKDGYKIVRGRIARTGIQGYLRRELGDDAPMGNPNDTLMIYRPDDEVFADETVNGWAHVPVTLDHPSELVTPDNVKQYAIGEVTSKGRIDLDGGWFDLEFMVKDAPGITALDSTHKEVSGGYTAMIDFTPGVTPDGKKYDGVQRSINPNHLALVPKGRAFSDADTTAYNWGATPVIQDKEVKMDMKPIAVGDAVVNVAAADADKITKLISDHAAAIEAKDTEIGELKAECKDANDKVLTDADVEKLVADRMAVVTKVNTLVADYDATGKSVSDIKRDAVKSVYGDEAAGADVSDAEINGIFRVMTPKKVNDDAREVLSNPKQVQDADTKINDAINKRFNKEAK